MRSDLDAPLGESRVWPSVAVGAVAALGLLLPSSVSLGPTLLVPSVVGIVLVPLLLAAPVRRHGEARLVRLASIALGVVVVLGNLADLALLVEVLLEGRNGIGGPELLRAALVIWLWNIVAFALIFWELDAGGPHVRGTASGGAPDFLFPQMTLDAEQLARIAPAGFRPRFVDYLYVSATNTTAARPRGVDSSTARGPSRGCGVPTRCATGPGRGCRTDRHTRPSGVG